MTFLLQLSPYFEIFEKYRTHYTNLVSRILLLRSEETIFVIFQRLSGKIKITLDVKDILKVFSKFRITSGKAKIKSCQGKCFYLIKTGSWEHEKQYNLIYLIRVASWRHVLFGNRETGSLLVRQLWAFSFVSICLFCFVFINNGGYDKINIKAEKIILLRYGIPTTWNYADY